MSFKASVHMHRGKTEHTNEHLQSEGSNAHFAAGRIGKRALWDKPVEYCDGNMSCNKYKSAMDINTLLIPWPQRMT